MLQVSLYDVAKEYMLRVAEVFSGKLKDDQINLKSRLNGMGEWIYSPDRQTDTDISIKMKDETKGKIIYKRDIARLKEKAGSDGFGSSFNDIISKSDLFSSIAKCTRGFSFLSDVMESVMNTYLIKIAGEFSEKDFDEKVRKLKVIDDFINLYLS